MQAVAKLKCGRTTTPRISPGSRVRGPFAPRSRAGVFRFPHFHIWRIDFATSSMAGGLRFGWDQAKDRPDTLRPGIEDLEAMRYFGIKRIDTDRLVDTLKFRAASIGAGK